MQNEIQTKFKKWEKLTLTMLDSLHLVQSYILPIFLLLFWAFPSHIFNKQLLLGQKMLLNFFWNNKKYRINIQILLGTKTEGELSFPILIHYFQAVEWIQLMEVQTFPYEIRTIIWEKTTERQGLIKKNSYFIYS